MADCLVGSRERIDAAGGRVEPSPPRRRTTAGSELEAVSATSWSSVNPDFYGHGVELVQLPPRLVEPPAQPLEILLDEFGRLSEKNGAHDAKGAIQQSLAGPAKDRAERMDA